MQKDAPLYPLAVLRTGFHLWVDYDGSRYQLRAAADRLTHWIV